MFTKSSFVRILIALVVMLSVGLSGFYSGAINTTPVFIAASPTATVTPTPTHEPTDLWQSIRGCDLSYAKIETAEVPADANNPASYDGSETHEVWALYVFGDKSLLDGIDPDKLHDRWDNPITTIVSDTTLDAISNTNLTVWIFNEYGYLAGWDVNGWDEPTLQVTGFCHQVEGMVGWATTEELTKLGEYSFVYPTDQIHDWYGGGGFTVDFYTGITLDSVELNILDFQVRGLDEGSNWAGLGFVGPSSSTHGLFDINDNGQLVWEFRWWNPDYDISENTGLVLPVNTEIVVKTTYTSGEVILQRFVLRPGYDHPDMTEPIYQPSLP
jgi:hypothetical protein